MVMITIHLTLTFIFHAAVKMRALAAGALLMLLGFLDLGVPSAALLAPRHLALGHRLLSLREKLQAPGLRTDEALQKVSLRAGRMGSRCKVGLRSEAWTS